MTYVRVSWISPQSFNLNESELWSTKDLQCPSGWSSRLRVSCSQRLAASPHPKCPSGPPPSHRRRPGRCSFWLTCARLQGREKTYTCHPSCTGLAWKRRKTQISDRHLGKIEKLFLYPLLIDNLESILLADWFARNNVDNTIIFIQFVLLFLFRLVQLLARINHSSLEVWYLQQMVESIWTVLAA